MTNSHLACTCQRSILEAIARAEADLRQYRHCLESANAYSMLRAAINLHTGVAFLFQEAIDIQATQQRQQEGGAT